MSSRSIKIAAAIAATGFAATLFSMAPADAAGPTFAEGSYGEISAGSVNARIVPTTASKVTATFFTESGFTIRCKVQGSSVKGNNVWYSIKDPASKAEWISARYVTTSGKAPRWCGNGKEYRGKVTASSLTQRTGPTTGSPKAGSLKKGTSVKITCKVKGGTPVHVSTPGSEPHTYNAWYQLTNGTWVAAAHVDNVGKAPVSC